MVYHVEFQGIPVATRSNQDQAIRSLWNEYNASPEECQTPGDWAVTLGNRKVYVPKLKGA